MTSRLFALVAACVAVIAGAILLWPEREPAPSRAPVARAPDAIATVAGRPLTLADVGVRVGRLGSSSPEEAHAAILAALEKRIDGDLLAGEAERLGIALSDADRASLRANEPAGEALEKLLLEEGLTPDEWRAARERALLAERVIDQAVYAQLRVTQAEVEAYVAEHRVAFRSPDRYRLRGIFVSSPANAAPPHALAARERVDRALAALARKRPFAEVAREHSDGIEGSRGGELGELASGEPPLDDPRLAAAVSALAGGGVTDAVRTEAGWWILRLEAHLPPADLPFEQVRERATAALVRARGAGLVRAYLDGLRARAQVTILLPPPDEGMASQPATVRP